MDQGVNGMLGIDAERRAEGRPAWTFAASGGPLPQPMRADAPTAEACLAQALTRLSKLGVTVPF